MPKHIIWSDRNLDLDDWRDDLIEQMPELAEASESTLHGLMVAQNADHLNDERMNLDIIIDQPILIIADLGLWDGRHPGYKLITSRNIRDCLYSNCDYNEWYLDQFGNFRCDAVHHDGTNHYLYRAVKPNISDAQLRSFLRKIFNGTHTRRDITRYTRSLGPEIRKVYGW